MHYDFRGWIPTITGNISYSMGKAPNLLTGNFRNRIFFNNTASKSGIFLSIDEAKNSKFLKSNIFITRIIVCKQSHEYLYSKDADGNNRLNLSHCGQLQGTVYYFYQKIKKREKSIRQIMNPFILPRVTALNALKLRTNNSYKTNTEQNIIDMIDNEHWNFYQSDIEVFKNRTSLAFPISILRSGEIRISLSTKAIDRFSNERQYPKIEPSEIAKRFANDIFNTIKESLHLHHHHKPKKSDPYFAEVHLLDQEETWRRKTLYSIIRSAFLIRRQKNIESILNAKGILAYAEAFQKQFLGWSYPKIVPNVPSSEYHTIASSLPLPKKNTLHEYDFNSLKQSMDVQAQLINRRASRRLQLFLFLISTFFATVTLSVQMLRIYLIDKGETQYEIGGVFGSFVSFMARNLSATAILIPAILIITLWFHMDRSNRIYEFISKIPYITKKTHNYNSNLDKNTDYIRFFFYLCIVFVGSVGSTRMLISILNL